MNVYKACDELIAVALIPAVLYGLKTVPWFTACGLLGVLLLWPRATLTRTFVDWVRRPITWAGGQ